MNTTGIIVSEKTYDNRGTTTTATRGTYELQIDNINGVKFINATIDRGEFIEIVDHNATEWQPFFIAIHNSKS